VSDQTGSVEVADPAQVIAFVSPREGQTLTLSYERKGIAQEANIVPVSGIVPDVAAVGIYMDVVGTLRLPPHVALWVGLKKTYEFTQLTVVGLASFLGDIFLGRSDFSQVTGPVGIVRAVGDAAGIGFTNVILFTALISINLAVINIIPFPALDGGRLLFIVIEGIMHRPIKPRVANAFNIAGFALLMLLMLAVTYHDVAKLLQ
jgi:regulator of sigma E protease